MQLKIIKENRYLLSYLLVILGVALLNKFTQGWGLILVVLMGFQYAAKKQMGKLFLCYLFIPFITNMNYSIAGSCNTMVARLGSLALTVVLLLMASNRQGNNSLPLGVLYLYLFVAVLSSMSGWNPVVSYFKIINFLVFLVGVHLGTRNIHTKPEQVLVVRNGLLAFAVFMILGSMISRLFPSVGYSMEFNMITKWGLSDHDAAGYIANNLGRLLFSGLTNHSQVLGPEVALFSGWVLADMLFCIRRVSSLHILLLACAPILIFWAGSRTAFLGFFTCIGLISLLAFRDSAIPFKVKYRIQMLFRTLLLLLIVGCAIMECRNHGFTRFLRKNSGDGVDERSISEAFTESRMGAVEMNMAYFHMNPLLGMGFQTWEFHTSHSMKDIFSAPIEKGVLPLMILGETGAIGAAIFLVFLIAFSSVCVAKGYTTTLILFWGMIMENMGEAVFFSPAAVGGVMWVIACVGGFCIDMKKFADKKTGFMDPSDMNGGRGMLIVPPPLPPRVLPPPRRRRV